MSSAVDTFQNTDGTQLTTHNAAWALNAGSFQITSNAASPTAIGINLARYVGSASTPDQKSSARVIAIDQDTIGQVGVAVRVSPAGDVTHYSYEVDAGTRYLIKRVSGGYTQLARVFTPPVAGDIISLEVSGTTLTPKINGVLDSLIGPIVDPSITNGVTGISGYLYGAPSASILLDDWGGGDLNVPPEPPVALEWNEAELSWDANTESDLAGYRVYWGPVPRTTRVYDFSQDVGLSLSHIFSGLTPGTWYFAVTAYDTSMNSSEFSDEVSKVIFLPSMNFLPVVLMPSVQIIKHASY